MRMDMTTSSDPSHKKSLNQVIGVVTKTGSSGTNRPKGEILCEVNTISIPFVRATPIKRCPI